MQPSGRSHIGNYAGAYQGWLDLQDQADLTRYFFIADYHSITEDYDPKEKHGQIMDLAMDYLAIGLDPEKSVIFVQSEIPEHTELCWIFNTVTPMPFLERMTQFKDKSEQQSGNVNMGLFDYPILQAADILMYKSDRVPVGRDQIQHVELTRDVARFFNNKFGDTFPEPKELLTDIPKMKSLTEPLKKMSKSFGEKSYIALTDEPDVIREKVMRAVTEQSGMMTLTEKELEQRLMDHVPGSAKEEELRGMAGAWNLLTLLRICGKKDDVKKFLKSQPIKYSELKEAAADAVSEHFADFRERRKALAEEPEKVRAILDEGSEKARKVAKVTMEEVRERIGIR